MVGHTVAVFAAIEVKDEAYLLQNSGVLSPQSKLAAWRHGEVGR